jgi:hypothetical protein
MRFPFQNLTWFLVYANDMGSSLSNSSLCQYADDSNIVSRNKSGDSLEANAFVDMGMIQQWLDEHCLSCNYTKTNFLLFRAPNKPNIHPSLFMADTEIDRVSEVKFLGIMVDEHLSWNRQVDECCRKLSSAVFALRSLARECNDRQALLIVYHGLFMSTARYGIIAWGATSESNMDRVLKLQKKAIRVIANLGWRDSCRGVFTDLGLLTVPSAYILDSIMYVLQKGNPTSVGNITGRLTRQVHDLHLSPTRTHKSDSHVLRNGRILFNALPGDIKALRGDLRSFKRKLLSHLLAGAFYSVSEFKRVSGGSG